MILNNQKPEAADRFIDGSVDFHSMFFTLQGEGPHTGVRSIFIRLAGCNLQCPWCDTEYTQGRRRVEAYDLAKKVIALAEESKVHISDLLIVITGGEPLRQNIDGLIHELRMWGMRVQIESNGVFAVSPRLKHWLQTDPDVQLIVSPKTSRINDQTARVATAFKYVIEAGAQGVDGLPTRALGHKATPEVARPPRGMKVYINPMDAKDEAANRRNLEACRDAALKHGYQMGVQLHKLLNLE